MDCTAPSEGSKPRGTAGMLGKTVGAGGKSPAERDEAHDAVAACCGFGEAIGGRGEERGEKGAAERGKEVMGSWVFGLERPGGGPILGSILGAMAQRAREEKKYVRKGERDRKGKRGRRKGAQFAGGWWWFESKKRCPDMPHAIAAQLAMS